MQRDDAVKKLLVIIGLLILIFAAGIIYKMQEPFPTESIKRSVALSKLKGSDKEIVMVGTAEEKDWYLTRTDAGEGEKRFIAEIESQGWTFDEQFGAGLIFNKANEKLITTCVIWYSRYLVCEAPTMNE